MNINFRFLERGDFDRGFLQLLDQLAPVRDFSKEFFERIFDEISTDQEKKVFVGLIDDKLICTGTLLVERKFFFGGKFFCHVEDVVVDEKMRGKGIGKALMNHLVEYAKSVDCARLVLDCVDDKKEFYVKCGFYRKGNQMNLELVK